MNKKDNKRRIVAGISNALAMALALGFGGNIAQAQQAGGDERREVVSGVDMNAFWTDAKAGYQFRTSYFDRRSAGGVAASPADQSSYNSFRQQAMGLGGWLYGSTGELFNVLSFGGAYNFTIPLCSPDDTPYNYILRDPGQDPVPLHRRSGVLGRDEQVRP